MDLQRVTILCCAAALALCLSACGGGSGGGGTTLPNGALQVLNNTGSDLQNVEVRQGLTTIDGIGGGLAQGSSWTFSNLPPGIYDVHAFLPGQMGTILHYYGLTVTSAQTTNFTMTP